MTRERINRKQVTYTTSKRRRSFELRSGSDDKLWVEVKTLSKILSDWERLKTPLPPGTMKRVELLPDYVKEHFRKDGLIEWTKSKSVPTLGVFLAEYGASRPGKESMHKRLTSYLIDYFGVHKRLDAITPPEAAGILSFWANDRKKKGKRGGILSPTTITKALTWVKSAFKTAVEWGYLERSPFAKVKCDNVETNKKRHYRVSLDEFYTAVGCLDDVELRGFLAFARLAGMRRSDIRDLRFNDIKPVENGRMVIHVPPTGKTGERNPPLFDSLRPFYDDLVVHRQEGQIYLFPRCRAFKDLGAVSTLIRKAMFKAGLEPWTQLLTNCRRTRCKELRQKGYTEQERTAILGNSPMVRARNYDGDLTLSEIALLGVENADSCIPVPAGIPTVPGSPGSSAEPETFEVELFHFGLPNDERYFPTLFPTLPSEKSSVWEMIDNGAGYIQVIVAALLRVGYSGKAAWRVAENDKYAFQFYMDLIYWRERICDYQKQRISYVEMLGSIVVFCFKNLRRAWRGSIISRECLSPSNLDKMAGAGLEPAALRL